MPRVLVRRVARLVIGIVVTSACQAVPWSGAGAIAEGSIVVHVAGDRDPVGGGARPIGGVAVRAYTNAELTSIAGECVTEATGECTITGLADGSYWVAPNGEASSGGPGFRRIDTVSTSTHGDVHYAEQVVVGEGNPETRVLVQRRANPPFPSHCGVALALIFDLSGSINADEAQIMKTNSKAFVDALAGTASSIAIESFATAAPAGGNTDLPLTSVAGPDGVATVKAAVDALKLTAGDDQYTNWDAALRAVPEHADLVVIFTDGKPTVHGVPAVFPPVITGFGQIEAGVLSANMVKARGTRIAAVGVGEVAEISAPNLQAISGPVEGADYAITTFARVHEVFHALADALCPEPVTPIVTEPEIVVAPEPVPVTPKFTG